jgi:lysozyme
LGANAAGVLVGYYHYAHPETNRALDEARAFVEATKGRSPQLPYVLDLEGAAANLGKVELTTWALVFMREVKKLTCADVMLYTGAYFARDEVGVELAEFPLWIAHYGALTPLANSTWEKWTCFQYTSSGSVAGIAGNVDMNEYNGSVSELVRYQMSAEDANKVIAFLKAGYDFVNDPESHAEFKRIANELRKVSGQPIEFKEGLANEENYFYFMHGIIAICWELKSNFPVSNYIAELKIILILLDPKDNSQIIIQSERIALDLNGKYSLSDMKSLATTAVKKL